MKEKIKQLFYASANFIGHYANASLVILIISVVVSIILNVGILKRFNIVVSPIEVWSVFFSLYIILMSVVGSMYVADEDDEEYEEEETQKDK